jgi:phosphatidylserine decarboxylase
MKIGFISITQEGLPYLGILLVLIIIAGILSPKWAIIPLIMFVFVGFFFRDPKRVIPQEPGLVLSSADGKVVIIDEVPSPVNPNEKVKRVSVFLSVFNVHINRTPVPGTVKLIRYTKGKFHNAMEGKSSIYNENNLLEIEHQGKQFWVKQIAGMIARRIVCYCSEGDILNPGDKIGMIKFGSRTDVFLPIEAEVMVHLGDRVKGGESILARMKN